MHKRLLIVIITIFSLMDQATSGTQLPDLSVLETVSEKRVHEQTLHWQDIMSNQKMRRVVTYAALGAGTAACGYALFRSWNNAQNINNQQAGNPDNKKEAQDASLFLHVQMARILKQRQSFWGRVGLGAQDGVERAITTFIASLVVYGLAKSESFIVQKLKSYTGFCEELLFVSCAREALGNYFQLIESQHDLLLQKQSLALDSVLGKKLLQQLTYGVFIDHKALMISLESCIGFIRASQMRLKNDGQSEHADQIEYMLIDLIDLINKFVMDQQVNASDVHAKSLGHQMVRCFQNVGKLLYGKEFSLQSTGDRASAIIAPRINE